MPIGYQISRSSDGHATSTTDSPSPSWELAVAYANKQTQSDYRNLVQALIEFLAKEIGVDVRARTVEALKVTTT